MSIVIAALAFLSVVVGMFGVWTVVQGRSTARLERLRAAPVATPAHTGGSLLLEADRGARRLISRLGGRHSGESTTRLRERMIHAGYRRPSAAATFYGIRVLLAVGLPVIAAAIPLLWVVPFVTLTILLCALAGIGYIVPSLWVDRAVQRRQGGIQRVLPDALDLMVVCVEAGFGINQALARVGEEFAQKSPVLATELALVNHETRAGKSLTEALRGLAERTGVSDVSALVALLVQTEKFGTSVADALRVHAEAMRIRRMQRAEERAQMAPLKLILPSTMIFAALMILFLAPSLARVHAAFPD